MISRCIIWILYGLWLINIHKPLLLSTSHPQDTPARPRSWVWVSRFVAPAKAQYLGGGDPWPSDIGRVYHGKWPSDTRRLWDISQKKHVGMGSNMGVDRWVYGLELCLYDIQQVAWDMGWARKNCTLYAENDDLNRIIHFWELTSISKCVLKHTLPHCFHWQPD